MMVIEEQLEKNFQKIKLIENFVALSLKRDKVFLDVNDVKSQVEEVKREMLSAQNAILNELEDLKTRHDSLMRKMLQQQKLILEHVRNERHRKIQEAEEIKIEQVLGSNKKLGMSTIRADVQIDRKKQPSSSCKNLKHSFDKMQLNSTINAYKESPMAKQERSIRSNTIPFIFREFEAEITLPQFETIPKYMRGRETICDLNTFLTTVIMPCFNDKYRLLFHQRNTVRSPSDLTLWKLYNDQSNYVPGKHFITSGDISRKLKKLVDKKAQNRLVMLRHIGLLQEQRISQTTCYIWAIN